MLMCMLPRRSLRASAGVEREGAGMRSLSAIPLRGKRGRRGAENRIPATTMCVSISCLEERTNHM